MPYNNTPITPSKEVTGNVSLPLARVQKIINADPEHLHVSKNASFAIALATEMFIQHLATSTHNVVKTERKPRRNIQYKDVANAVAKTDNLEFLSDVVPKTTTYGDFKKKQEVKKQEAAAANKGKEKAAAAENSSQDTTQRTVPGPSGSDPKPATNGDAKPETPSQTGHHPQESTTPHETSTDAPEAMEVDKEKEKVDDSEPEEDGVAMQIEMEMRGPRVNGNSEVPPVTQNTQTPPVAEVRRSGGFTAINGTK